MNDDYAFPQAMVRGLGLVPEGVGASSGPPTAAHTAFHFQTVPLFDRLKGYWYFVGVDHPSKAPSGFDSGVLGVPATGTWRSVGSGMWVWYPKPGTSMDAAQIDIDGTVWDYLAIQSKSKPPYNGVWTQSAPSYWFTRAVAVAPV
jgi:hypothetical protein